MKKRYTSRPVRSSTRTRGKRPIKAAKVYTDGFGNYAPWSGATQTWSILEQFDRLDELESWIDEIYYSEEMGEGVINETELNDLLWFEPETVYEAVGLYYNADTDEVSDEPFEITEADSDWGEDEDYGSDYDFDDDQEEYNWEDDE